MAKESQPERQLRVAREGLARALAAAHPDDAVQHLLQLPPGAEREDALLKVGPLVRAEVQGAFAAQRWDRIGYFVARVAKEPSLLSAGAESSEVAAAGWALMWGAIKGKVWPRAEAQLALLRPGLPAPLADALGLLISHQGNPPAELRAGFPEPPAPDPRLGYDPIRSVGRVVVPAPRGPDEVESHVVDLFALSDWATFSETARRWVDSAAPLLQGPLATAVASLAVRELLEREDERILDPARLIGRAAQAAGSSPELLAAVRLALRRVMGATPEEIHKRPMFDALDAVARAALRYPELRGMVQAALDSVAFGVGLREPALDLMAAVDAAAPSAPLIWKALRVARLGSVPRSAAPAWLVAGMEREVTGGRLGPALHALAHTQQAQSLGAASLLLPVRLVEKLVDRLWEGADPELRQGLAFCLEELLDRESEGPSNPADAERLFVELMRQGARMEGMDERETERLVRSPEGQRIARESGALDFLGENAGDLSRAGRELFARQAQRLIPMGIGFLETALELARSVEERQAATRQFWDGNPEPAARLRALYEAEDTEEAIVELRRHLLSAHGTDGPFLCRALSAAWAQRAERGWITSLAAAVTVAALDPHWKRTADEEQLVQRARSHLARSSRVGPRRRSKTPPRPRQPSLPAPRWVPGDPFNADNCLARFTHFLQEHYAVSTATNYSGAVRRFFTWLRQEGRLKGIHTQHDLIDGANAYLASLHREGKSGGAYTAAFRALFNYLAATPELEHR